MWDLDPARQAACNRMGDTLTLRLDLQTCTVLQQDTAHASCGCQMCRPGAAWPLCTRLVLHGVMPGSWL